MIKKKADHMYSMQLANTKDKKRAVDAAILLSRDILDFVEEDYTKRFWKEVVRELEYRQTNIKNYEGKRN